MKRKALKYTGIALLSVLALILMAAISYIIYVFASYYRIEDNLTLDCEGEAYAETLSTDVEYKAISYNIGFCAYTRDFGFFMDGGDGSRAESPESVKRVLGGINSFLYEQDADIILLQEVDVYATRSYHINQKQSILDALADKKYSSSFAVNYDSPYLFYPFDEPHGKSLAGMLTMSKYKINSSVRRSLPIEDSLMKLVDIDRCYSVSRISVEGGAELVIYTVHLSAYTSDGTVATRQLEMLIADMQAEYDKGNYVVCGGDFNKDLLGNSAEIFGVSGEGQTWAQPIPEETFEGASLSLVAPFNEDSPTPSCRNADGPYNESQFVLTVDGFIVSDNVRVVRADVIDLGFEYSDHNPVELVFELIG